MRRVFASLLAAVALLAAGCGKGTPDLTPVKPAVGPLAAYIGTWTTKDEDMTITATILESGKFTLSAVSDLPKGDKHLVTGSASVANGRLLLTADEIDGKPPTKPQDKEPQKLMLSADGKTLESEDGNKLTRR